MRNEIVKCDTCGQEKPPRPAMPKTWWTIQDGGERTRTGALDFCSLPCIAAFVADGDVQRIYAMDFVAPARTPLPRRDAALRSIRRWRLFGWLFQLQVMRVR